MSRISSIFYFILKIENNISPKTSIKRNPSEKKGLKLKFPLYFVRVDQGISKFRECQFDLMRCTKRCIDLS